MEWSELNQFEIGFGKFSVLREWTKKVKMEKSIELNFLSVSVFNWFENTGILHSKLSFVM